MVGENEPQESILLRPREEGGHGLDALWNDDWHHSAIVALTGRSEAYYSDYHGAPQEFVSATKYGFLYQGQHYGWQQKRRGTPTHGIPPHAFVHFLQNHDQVANSTFVLRWFGAVADGAADRLLLVNLGRELHFSPAPEPLLGAACAGCRWELIWSSESPAYGGLGHTAPETGDGRWVVPAACAVLLGPAPRSDRSDD